LAGIVDKKIARGRFDIFKNYLFFINRELIAFFENQHARIVDWSDYPVYVMTSEFGSPSQLEKIDMLDFAKLVVVNKFEKQGSEDAIRDVSKQMQRNLKLWDTLPVDLPVFGAIASKFNDDGV
jgi:Putative periplasmic protein kinase ArgK and related GTPases of G3E family